MTSRQRELARHALGFPNKKNTSYRNHFCAGPGHLDYSEWLRMVEAGYAIRRTGTSWGGDDMFFLTLRGGLLARDKKEHLSRKATKQMRNLEARDILTAEREKGFVEADLRAKSGEQKA